MGTRVLGITFDLWDTLIVDDSDEPKRAAQGLAPKPVERRELVQRFLERHGGECRRELVDVAYDTVDAAFHRVWYEQNVTWTVRERLSVLLAGLGAGQVPEAELQELIRQHEEMELRVRPDLAAGVVPMLEALHGRYRLAVISDAIFSPGRALRALLDGYGILRFFDALVFSDEVGRAKPAPIAFESAAQQLGVALGQMAHVGDREAKDVAGPQAVGATSILCTVVKDRGSDGTQADAICQNFDELPLIVELLERG